MILFAHAEVATTSSNDPLLPVVGALALVSLITLVALTAVYRLLDHYQTKNGS